MNFLDQVERVALAAVARLGVWVAPFPPAYFVARSAERRLGTARWAAWVIAVVVEVAGIAAAAATLRAYSWNREKLKSDAPAPVGLCLALCAVYLAVGITVSVLLELRQELAVLAPALFFLLAGQVYVTAAMMADQARREEGARAAKRERQEVRRERKGSAVGSTDKDVAVNEGARSSEQLALVAEAAQGDAFGAAEVAQWAMCGRTAAYQVVKFGLATGRLARAGRGRYVCKDGVDDG
jgi:hypothetical protein